MKLNTAIGWGMSWEHFQDCGPIRGVPDRNEYFNRFEEMFEDTGSFKFGPFTVTRRHESVVDLVTFAGNGDDWDHVIFFPTSEWKPSWRRIDDRIDYAFFRGESEEIPEAEFTYLPIGHYPFQDYTMNPDGTEGPRVAEWTRTSETIPGLPPVMRAWIERYKVLDNSGIAKLRPIRGRWWS